MQKIAVKFNVGHEELEQYTKRLIVRLCGEDEGPSEYKNYIYIPRMFVDNKRVYAEEGMHFLRLYCSKQNDGMVQEFFAGIAVVLFSDEKNLVFWKESDEETLLSLLEDKRVNDAIKEEVEHALDSMAGYDMANALHKQNLIDRLLYMYPRLIYDSDQDVVMKVLKFWNQLL